jgi:hypothetical protein
MKPANVLKYVLGSLAALALTGLLVWLIGREGERTRQAIRDSRRDAETTPSAVPQPAQDTKPAAAESEAGTEEDFNLDDHVVFPGLADEVSKTRAKPRVDPPPGNRESAAEKTNRTGSK